MNFNISGGEVIRVTGILNALASKGVSITLFTLMDEIPQLKGVEVVKLPPSFHKINKRQFQFALSHGDIKYTNALFKQLLLDAKEIFSAYNEPILFFEYLDISIGYWLNENGLINGYLTDVHGISPLEFDSNERRSLRKYFINRLKKYSAEKLDRKIYRNATNIMYTSEGVKNYLEDFYNLDSEKGFVVNESINNLLLEQEVDKELRDKLITEYDLNAIDTVILFAGTFKEFGGIADLVKAYILLKQQYDLSTKLLLIGDGELFEFCKNLVAKAELDKEIVFLGRQPYQDLKTYHSISDVIVCPDKDTKYSQILPHIKYFDSLASGNIVINGNFEFTEDLNPKERFSLDFEPSNIESLKDTLLRAIINKSELSSKYYIASKEAINQFNYDTSIEKLFNYIEHRNKKAN